MTDTPPWPSLDLHDLAATLETLHLWTQIVGKTKLSTLPWLNESWHVPLLLSASGLTTGLVVAQEGPSFEISIDLVRGSVRLFTVDGLSLGRPLTATSTAAFQADVLDMIAAAGVCASVSPRPCEIEDAVPFAEDEAERYFDLSAARAYWRALVQVQRVFHRFRSRFVGKCSPIHFFWGSFDLAVTRFSGRGAPLVEHGAPNASVEVMRDAYAGEQVSFGFWPGGSGVDEPSFYIEAWPAPGTFNHAAMKPKAARFVEGLGEWVLGYSAVAGAAEPDGVLLDFLQSGYEAVAEVNDWDRTRLERAEGLIGYPPPLGR